MFLRKIKNACKCALSLTSGLLLFQLMSLDAESIEGGSWHQLNYTVVHLY